MNQYTHAYWIVNNSDECLCWVCKCGMVPCIFRSTGGPTQFIIFVAHQLRAAYESTMRQKIEENLCVEEILPTHDLIGYLGLMVCKYGKIGPAEFKHPTHNSEHADWLW